MSSDVHAKGEVIPRRLGIIAPGPPTDVRTWSGVPLWMTTELDKRFEEVVYLPAPSIGPGRARWHRAQAGAVRLIGRRCLPHMRTAELARRGRGIARLLDSTSVDAIFAITVDHHVAFLDTDVPIVRHSDTTFDGIVDAYEHVSDLLPASRRQGHEIARRAIERTAISTYPSRWAARSAIDVYDADPDTVHVVPYGANLDEVPSLDDAIDVGSRTRCRLLFIGRDWVRKGGPLAFDTFLELRRRGIDAEMVVVGTDPHLRHDALEIIPFLNKQVPDQLERYRELWRTSAFLVMPSRAETFGAIHCEAAAHGVPVIATDVGGVGDAVIDGTSGRLFSPDAGPLDYATAIETIWSDRDLYATLVNGARRRYETDLNWEVWCDRTTRLIAGVVNAGENRSRGTR